MSHANAPLTPEGRRRLAVLIVDDGWSVRRAAERFQVSPATASKWARRYRAGEPMVDASSRPRSSPTRCNQRLERRIVKLRFTKRWGPHRISYHLGVPRSTVGRVLGRYRMPLLAHIDQATGLAARSAVPALEIARAVAGHTGPLVLAEQDWLALQGVAEWSGPRSLPLWIADRSWYGMNARSTERALAAGLPLRALSETLADSLAWDLEHFAGVTRGAGLSDADERELLAALT